MGSKYDDSAVVELTGKIMVIAIIILFLVILFVFFLHLYAKWFWYRLDDQNPPSRRRRRRRQDGSVGEEAEDEEVVSVSLGLDPIILKSIPIVKFNPKDGELECAVCLSELAAGENARMLPKCSHGFHVECIDMWFHSHSTCPLCRNPISILNQMIQIPPPENQSSSSSSSSIVTVNVTGTETPNFPTNVLFWGNESQVSTLGACLDEDDRRNRHSIQIPIQNPSSSSDGGGMGIEEEDSKSPLPARMRSFKRLLSRDRRVNPSNVDLEQGSRSQA